MGVGRDYSLKEQVAKEWSRKLQMGRGWIS